MGGLSRKFTSTIGAQMTDDVCGALKRGIDDLTENINTGEVLGPRELDREELIQLAELQRQFTFNKCACTGSESRVIKVKGFGSKSGYRKEYPYTKELYTSLRSKAPNETLIWVD